MNLVKRIYQSKELQVKSIATYPQHHTPSIYHHLL